MNALKSFLLIVALMASASAFVPATKMRPSSPLFATTTTPTTTTTTSSMNSPFSEYAQTDDQGLAYQDSVIGSGEVAEKGKVLTIAYKGRLMATGKQFDQGSGYSFRLGDGKVIPGWEQGLEGMKIGGKRTLRIPPSLAYADRGAKGVIPPWAHVEFDCELVSIASNPVEEAYLPLNMHPARILGIAFFIGVLAVSPMFPQ